MYCSRCKTTEGSMIKYNKSIMGKQYYHCRPCNTARLAKYRKTQNGAERTRIAINKSIEKYQDKQNARLKVAQARKTGKLIKPTCCSKCNTETKIEGHHEDYTKPLEVIWVCRSCHRQLDKLLKQ